MTAHRGLDRDQAALLQQIIASHGGDVDAALDSWTLAVRKLAAVDTRQRANWWGKATEPKRPLTAAARHWSKHAVVFPGSDTAAGAPVTAYPYSHFDALPTLDQDEVI